MHLIDKEQVLDYLKSNPNRKISSYEIMTNTNLFNNSQSSVSRTIQAINYYTDYYIQPIIGGVNGGGYIYYG